MARVEIDEVVISSLNAPVAGASVEVRNRGDGSLATVYADEANPGALSQPLLTDSLGRINGWVEQGQYTLRVLPVGNVREGTDQPFDADTYDPPADSDAPIFTEDFVDIGDWDPLAGTLANWSVAGGVLVPSVGGVKHIEAPVDALADVTVKVKLKAGAANPQYFGVSYRVINANDFCNTIINTDDGTMKSYSSLGGVLSNQANNAISGFARNKDYWMVASVEGNTFMANIYEVDPGVDPTALSKSANTWSLGPGVAPTIDAGSLGGVGIWANADDCTFDDFKVWKRPIQ